MSRSTEQDPISPNRGRILVGGLGPAGPEMITAGTAALIRSGAPVYIRTARHPAVQGLQYTECLDDVYETYDLFEEVYQAIVQRLVQAAAQAGEILYLVPGSPVIAERTVELLLTTQEVDVVLHPAMSFLDLAWTRLRVDPLRNSVRLVDGQSFSINAASERGPMLVAQCWSKEILSQIKLSVETPPSQPVTLLYHLGLDDEEIKVVAWSDLDRSIDPDHLTSLWIPSLASPVGAELAALVELSRLLRQKCPWDIEQTHTSLARHLREEAFETLDAIAALDEDDPSSIDDLEEELGDLLYQVVFHCQLATEEGWFTLADVARGVHDKLYGRHPHVFGDQIADNPEAAVATWEERKRLEKGRKSVLAGIPQSLPALAFAQQLQRRAASLRDTQDKDDLLGDLFFLLVDIAARLGSDAEQALRSSAMRHYSAWTTKEAMRSDAGDSPPQLSS